ncbi:MAG TPA: polysaccharide deacetylase family protein [Bryobacteraceae bacterium]|nr:polysaccharide deacetylase family protein [Bryobacteraceae bacterium]
MVLTYHEILPEESRYAYAVTAALFREHLAFLADLPAGRSAAPVITFDDGHLSHYEYGMPLLEEHAFHAIFFVTAGWMQNRPSYMSWAQVRELAEHGHEVQSHGWSHAFLTGCNESELRRELEQSKDTLEQRLGKEVDAISMPGGRWNERVAHACVAAGYKRIYTSTPWLKPVERHGATHIGRCMIRRTTGLKQLRELLEAQNRRFHPHRLRHALKETARTVVGDRLYQWIWELASAKAVLRQVSSDRAGQPEQPRNF